jgi:peptidoglycan hydrolase CwlO-like protein
MQSTKQQEILEYIRVLEYRQEDIENQINELNRHLGTLAYNKAQAQEELELNC